MRTYLFLLCFLSITFSAFSQNSFHNKGDIFDDSIIHRIEVNIDTVDFNDIMSHPDSTLVKSADLAYLGDDPEIYRALNNGGGPVYELKTNKKEQNFSGLAKFITVSSENILNQLD